MAPSRIFVTLGILGGFAAGIGLAVFLNESPPAGNGTSVSPSASASSAPAASGLGGASNGAGGPASAEAPADGVKLTGQALVDRFWDCLVMPDEAERQRAWLGMLNKLTKEDAPAVRQLFKKMDKQGRWFVPEWDAFWPRWAMIDGPAAMASVEKNEGEDWKPYFADKLLRGWAQGDPEGALQWLREHRDSPMYGNGIRSYVDGLAKIDLDRATQFVLGERAEDTEGHLGKFMESLAERALQQRMVGGMTSWFELLPASSAKTAAVDAVAFRLNRADPARAMDWVGGQAGQPWRSDKAISDTAENLAKENPQKALEWTSNLPPSTASGRYNGLRTSVQSLAAKDPVAVETWLAQPNLDPILRDQGTAAYALQLMRTDPQAANEWMGKVSDKKLLTDSDRPLSLSGSVIIQGKKFRLQDGKMIEGK